MAAISAAGKAIVTADREPARVYDTTSASVRFALGNQSGKTLRAVYSSDGSILATAESDNFVRIRDAATGKVLKEQPFEMSQGTSLWFSPGKSDLLLMTSTNNAKVWDWRSGRPPIKLPELVEINSFSELDAAFSPDGRLVALPDGQVVSVWDARSECRLKVQLLHKSQLHGAGFSKDGRFILSNDLWTTKLWELPAGLKCEGEEVVVKEIALLDESKTGKLPISTSLLSPDGKFIVVTSIIGSPQVHNVQTGDLKFELRDGSTHAQGAAISSNGRFIVTANDDGKARVWDAATGTLLRTLDGEPGVPLTLVSFSPDDKMILTASDSQFNVVTVWDATTGKRMGQSFPGHLASFSPDGKSVVAVNGGDIARISDLTTGRPMGDLKGLTGKVTHVVFSDDGQRIIAATSDRRVGVWDAISGRQIARRKYNYDIESLAVGPGGRFVATVEARTEAEGWDLQTDKTIKLKLSTGRIGLSPDGKLAFSVSPTRSCELADNTKVVDVNNGAEIADLPGCLADYSSDGKLVAVIRYGIVRIVDVNSWQTRLELRGHSGSVTSAVFSPDGKFVVTTGYGDAAAIVWNVGSGAIETRLFGNTRDGLLSAAFSGDGKSILVVGDDKTARIYRCVMCGGWDELIERARERFAIQSRN